MNKLYFGDCLEILMKLKSETSEGFIDLVYIDPPFNSKRDYNILFEAADLKDVKAQKEAFADTWSNVTYKDTLQKIKEIDIDLFSFLDSLDKIRISKGAVAYLTTMAIRIWYIHKVIKPTGSFYLHCDPTMSHYLKLVCDLIFGTKNFRNEIVWRRHYSHNDGKKFGCIHDVILYYSKSNKYTFNKQKILYDEEYLRKNYSAIDPITGKHFRSVSLNAGGQGEARYFGDLLLDPPNGTHWRWKQDKINEKMKEGIIYFTSNGVPRYKQFPEDIKGVTVQDTWTDFYSLSSHDSERLDYPTQKPEELLRRIINTSSNNGDIVADFFCGCGTTIAVAQEEGRKWLGVDISHLAIGLIERRLISHYGNTIKSTYEVDGFPKDIGSAKQLASGTEGGRLKFQDWIIEAMLGGVNNPKKTADGGWDGHLTFKISEKKKEVILVEVKSGHVNVKNLREFIYVIDKQKAAIGIYVCFKGYVTKPMSLEAKGAGYYYFHDPSWSSNFDKIQIITVEDLLDGKLPNYPNSTQQTFKTAPRKRSTEAERPKLDLEFE